MRDNAATIRTTVQMSVLVEKAVARMSHTLVIPNAVWRIE